MLPREIKNYLNTVIEIVQGHRKMEYKVSNGGCAYFASFTKMLLDEAGVLSYISILDRECRWGSIREVEDSILDPSAHVGCSHVFITLPQGTAIDGTGIYPSEGALIDNFDPYACGRGEVHYLDMEGLYYYTHACLWKPGSWNPMFNPTKDRELLRGMFEAASHLLENNSLTTKYNGLLAHKE